MQPLLWFTLFIVIVGDVLGWSRYSPVQVAPRLTHETTSTALFMRRKYDPRNPNKNFPRKLKRQIRSLKPDNFSTILTNEVDSLLKSNMTHAVRASVIKTLYRVARIFNFTVDPDFGQVKTGPTLSILDHVQSNSSFEVRWWLFCATFMWRSLTNTGQAFSHLVDRANMTDRLHNDLCTLLLPSNQSMAARSDLSGKYLLMDRLLCFVNTLSVMF